MDIYEIAPSMRLLITMHNASVVDAGSAKNAEELNSLLNLPKGELTKALDELVAYGYVELSSLGYYLTKLGISVIRSVYT